MDVSFFRNIKGMDDELARAERNARIILDAGFTSVYSAGSLLPMPTEVILRDKIRAGAVPGPRLRAASMEQDSPRFARTAMSSRTGRARTPAARSSPSRPRWASTA